MYVYMYVCMCVKLWSQTYSGLKPGQRVGSFLHEPLRGLLREVTRVVSHLRKKSPERVVLFPELVSSFCLLFRTVPPSDPTDLAKYVFSAKVCVLCMSCIHNVHDIYTCTASKGALLLEGEKSVSFSVEQGVYMYI